MTPRWRKRKLWERPALFNSAGAVVSAGALAIVLLVNGGGGLAVLEAGHGSIDVPGVPLLTPSSPPAAPGGVGAPATVSTGVGTRTAPSVVSITAPAAPSQGAPSPYVATTSPAPPVVEVVAAVHVSSPPAATPTGAANPHSATSVSVAQDAGLSGGAGNGATPTSSVPVSSTVGSGPGNVGDGRGNAQGWGDGRGNAQGWGDGPGNAQGWGNGQGNGNRFGGGPGDANGWGNGQGHDD